MAARELKLGTFLTPAGEHIAAWRHPSVPAKGGTDFEALCAIATIAEAGKLDFLFAGDVSPNSDLPPDMLRRSSWLDKLDPLTVLSAVAARTDRIGLIGTATTTYGEPYSLARRFASLDHVSRGRAGWNVVTSMNHTDAANFGRAEHDPLTERYKRAEEFVHVARGLWDCWDDGAFTRDKESGFYVETAALPRLDHAGKFFRVRGPMDQPRPPQGHPVIVIAGASDEGRDLAARAADLVFSSQQSLGSAQAFYADIKARAAKAGRRPDEILVLTGFHPIVADSESAAREKFAGLQALLHPSVALSMLTTLLGGVDLSRFPFDEPLPPLPPAKGLTSRRDMLVALAKREGWTLRQLALHVAGSRGHPVVIGTGATVADDMENWFRQGGADG
ncbi:MAG: NtaA/DmoA family FMN-dependent monooxygenase, partial [Alphaproteobacteria bacterium]